MPRRRGHPLEGSATCAGCTAQVHVSSEALRRAAEYVRELPVDDQRFERLERAFAREEIADRRVTITLMSWLSDPEQYQLGLGDRTDLDARVFRYGYRQPAAPPDDFFSWFVDAVERELPGNAAKWYRTAGSRAYQDEPETD